MELVLYNMGFGESLLLSRARENLIIDLGSDQRGFSYCPIFSDISRRSADKSVSLLLTHFHLDHIAGLLDKDFQAEMPPITNVYIPNLLGVPVQGGFDLIKSSVLEEVLNGVLFKKEQREFTLTSVLRRISSLYTRVHFLSRGDQFHVDGKPYEVLWPDVHIANHVNGKTSGKFQRWFEALKQRNPDVDLFAAIEDYELKLVAELQRLAEGPREDHNYEGLLGAENTVWNTMRTVHRAMSGAEITSARALARSLKDLGNRLSIVFQDSIQKEPETLPIMMTGDVPPSILEKNILSSRKCNRKYQLIKAPHHGTETYFTPKLPVCKTIVISNGQPDPRNKRFGEISYQYSTVYASSSNPTPARLCCTSQRCRLLSFNPSRACPSHCLCGMGGSICTVLEDWPPVPPPASPKAP